MTSGYAPLVKFGHGYAAFFVGDNARVTRKLTLDYGVRSGKIKRGQLLLLEAFGGGFTWGSALLRY